MPSRSSYGEVPSVTTSTASQTSLWAIPDATPKATVTFQYKFSSTVTPSSTAFGASWPSQTPTPTYSSYAESPLQTLTTHTQTSLWAVPDASPVPTISFQFEAPPTKSPSNSPTPSKSLNAGESYVIIKSQTVVGSETHSITAESYIVGVSSVTAVTDQSGASSYTQVVTNSIQIVYIATMSQGLIIGLSAGVGLIVLLIE